MPWGPQENRVRCYMFVAATWLGASLLAAARADEPPLHERIDALVEGAALWPLAGPASDADFLRRAYLDLNGTIPDPATARAFLDDASPAKRTALVERLLDRPQFARHMARVFDVMLMERRAEKAIPAVEWQEYLRKSFESGKPLDQLCREILSADGSDPALRPAARFYLDRDGDSNLLARDLGRLFFGRDMQCAQCHDHPLIEDYLQADYYGLMAFVNRGVLFTGKDTKVVFAETADGEVNYKSVFTGDARDRVLPKLPQGDPLSEPSLTKEEQYVVAPAKDTRPVPKYSRRAQLAAAATSGGSAAFNRNWANRLWAMLMGRGLVHPLDVDHSGNPPVHSPLLSLLGDELVKMKFDTKAYLREVALSRAYQRSSEEPNLERAKLDPAASAATLASWNTEAERGAAEVTTLQAAASKATEELSAAYERYSKGVAARDAAEKTRAEAKKASDEVSAALAAALKDLAAKDEVSKALVEARDKALAAVAKLPNDKPLADAAAQFKARAEELQAQVTAAQSLANGKKTEVQAASLRLAEADKPSQAAATEVATARAALDAADARSRETLESLRTAKSRHAELTARIADARVALDLESLRTLAAVSRDSARAAGEQLAAAKAQAATDGAAQLEAPAKAAADKAAQDQKALDAASTALVDRATARFALAPLKPLSPEQLSWATMQALGLVDAQVAALAPQFKTDAEAAANLAPPERARHEERLLEERVDEKLRGNIAPFVSLFGQQPGQAPAFQATVQQALFLANGGLLAGWLNPANNNLTQRLAAIEQPAAVAEELYLSLLTRRPAPEEQAAVAAHWEASKSDRAAAAREMIWSLLASIEFRFNH